MGVRRKYLGEERVALLRTQLMDRDKLTGVGRRRVSCLSACHEERGVDRRGGCGC